MADALIELSNVTRTYQLGDETIYALKDVNLTIGKGESLAIVGPSGSGKSTLSNIIGGLDVPDSGTVMIDGKDLSHYKDRELSKYRNQYVGFVFQSFNLQPHLTALENVMLPLLFAKMSGKERLARATQRLTEVGLADRMRHLPTQLSGGQRQRVSIARSLVNNPSLIIADEPTGNLDSQRGEEIMDLLRDFNKAGTTLVVITHDAQIAAKAGRVVSIHDGKLTEHR